MNYSKDYQIKEWSKWLDELCDAARDFYKTFHKTPYLLEATKHTISQFEFMTAVAPVGNEIMNRDSNKLGNETENPKIRELTFKDEFTMTFVVNENLKDKTFRLRSDSIKIKSEEKGAEVNIEKEREKVLMI